MFSSYQKQALTIMISPLCTNCHDITEILLNVALNTITLTLYLQRYLSTFLSELQILFNFCQLFSYLDEFQISTIKFILHNSITLLYFQSSKKTYFLNRVLVYIYLPKASKYLYVSLNISIFLPRAGSSLYISVTIDFQISFS